MECINDSRYFVKCPEETCSENCPGETVTRIDEWVLEHIGKDNESHMLRDTLQPDHPSVSLNEFKILGKGFDNSRGKKKISEALLIKQYWPALNTQGNSVALELFD